MAQSSIRKIRSKTLYRGHVADLTLDTYRGRGLTFLRETIRHPPSVVILPVLSSNQVLLIRQYRHAVGRYIHEIPAGTSEAGESMLACAKRELEEETGYSAKRWERICRFYPAPGISTERMDLFVARELSLLKKRASMDQDEFIVVRPTSMTQTLRMIKNNQIIDAKSIIGILWGLQRIRWS